MTLEFAILGFLAQEPASGYELKNRCFGGAVRSFWSADQAQIYRTLDRLEHQGFVASELTHQAKRPSKRTFHLTDTGNDMLQEWLHSKNEAAPIRDPFALRLYFSNTLKPAELQELFSVEIAEQQTQLDEVEQELKKLGSGAGQRSKKARKDFLVKKSALEVIKMRVLAEIEYKNTVLSNLADLED